MTGRLLKKIWKKLTRKRVPFQSLTESYVKMVNYGISDRLVSSIADNGNIKTQIGIIKDITQLYLINIKLEERNQELERSISELESFNRVASHDLQEPLRKIQTFISRISEKESLNMSEAGKTYFEKILLSANQMRTYR